MPVLLRSQLDRTRHPSWANATRTLSQARLRPTSSDIQPPYVSPTSGSITELRRISCQSAASVGRRTIVSVIDHGDSKALSRRLKHEKLLRNASLFHQIKFCYRQLHLNYLLPLIIMLFYMVIGAVLFLWLEAPADLQRKQSKYENYERERELLLKRLEEIYIDRAAGKRRQRRLFLEEAIDYFHERVDVSFPNTTDWSLTTALYYSGTVFTTIGYGDVACYTVAGRIVTVLYACVGIPLMLITLNDLGKFLYKTINRLVKLCKCRKCCTFFATKQHPQPPSMSIYHEQDVELGQQQINGRSVSSIERNPLKFQLTIDTDELMTVDESNELDLEQELVQPGPPPRMPVMVAVGVTVGWIFFCAALFKIWEANWTYAESCYFMFISLSTIGLGDVAVERRDLMVICFIFVIIGLSLVSMCINVIQTAIEDVYMKLLMKILVEYQSKLAQGDDQVGASMGMMKMWGGNHTAKYLMPLLSKDKRMTAMAKVQEEAESKGIEVPPIFSDLDDESGMPKIFTINNDRKDSEISAQQAIEHAKHSMLFVPPSPSPPTIICYDAEIQTDNRVYLDKEEQTESTEMRDSGIDTEIRFADYICTAIQCGGDWEKINDETQTMGVEMSTAEVMTYCEPSTENVMQTDDVQCIDEALQTQLCDYLQMETQTDFIECDYGFVQTMPIETNEIETQTDEIDVSRSKSRVKRAQTWARDHRRDQPRRFSSSTIHEESDSSGESLDWNPIDGMHAEKQRPVRDLTRFFDKVKNNKKADK